MGTRSLTRILDNDGTELLCLYRQMDGYPGGHGIDLSNALAGSIMVNGIGLESKPVHNGMGCLAATVVAKLKGGPGSVYIFPVGSKECGEEYTYIVRGELGKEPTIEIEGVSKPTSASKCPARWKEDGLL